MWMICRKDKQLKHAAGYCGYSPELSIHEKRKRMVINSQRSET